MRVSGGGAARRGGQGVAAGGLEGGYCQGPLRQVTLATGLDWVTPSET